jgi:ABC-type multidrug transport system fused ATPase/permease subunit
MPPVRLRGDGRKAKDPKKTLGRLLKYLLKYKVRIFAVLACIFTTALVQSQSATALGKLVDQYINPMLASGNWDNQPILEFLVYLRMDGLRIPRVKYIRPKKKKDPMRHISSMSDYTDDDPPVTFEDLEPEEKDFCSLICNVVNMVIFGVLSFIL